MDIETIHQDMQNPASPSETSNQLTLAGVLSRIDRIMADTAYLHEVIGSIQKVPPSGPYSPESPATALGNLVQARETTNQQMLRLLEKMYDDLKPAKSEGTDDIRKFQMLAASLEDYPPEISGEILKRVSQQIFVKPGTIPV